jgi:DNA replication protein DnaC
MNATSRTSKAPSSIELFRAANVPQRHQRKVREEPPPWVQARDKIIRKIGSGFLIALIGRRGPGKTQIAEQAIVIATSMQRSALYVRAMTIFLDLRATFKSEADSEASIVERYRTPKLLVIDEMQERGETPWEDRMLNHLIDLRYGDMSDTLLVANLTRKALAKSLGESISERLRETGGIIECTWASFRKASNSPASTGD